MNPREKIAGVIGGMGPEATADFLRRIIAATPARDDADHIHVLVDNNPKIPSRLAALLEGGGEDPLPVLIAMARGLEKQGASFLTMPCNTAHYYLPAIAKAVSIPVLDMVALSIARLAAQTPRPSKIGMLASPAVQKVGLYESRLEEAGFTALFPNAADEARMLAVIRAVKAGNLTDQHRRDYDGIAAALERTGADAFLIACTELSVIGPPNSRLPNVDALDALVSATVEEAKGTSQ
ncbi:MAG: aspartate/glutamate racemase family protein [Proteobacteria bacterium]|nr:aspartate/glutamate racemase family protein [Pseudomonadota bacterium]